MSTLSVTYPVTPANVDQSILEPTSSFRQEVWKVLAAILFFVVVYLVMVVAAIGLAALCVSGGIGLIILKPMFLTLMLGLGLAGLGLMVVFFLFKFVFKRTKTDRSGWIEVTEAEQPQLFQFIRALSKETQTQFPKKIYIAPDVNASVFYDSSFWSMIFPVRKNLLIGLGLVNSVNISEFKAIIAHEFGHFSQRSMKLGSYVYNMNQVIYNMLYDNQGYSRTLETWANASGYFAFFADLTIKIVEGIQWVLQKVYGVMNKQYMSLSRQMEFHADTVAASVSGADHLITSLRRLDVANITYNNVFEYYNRFFKDALKPDNIYPQHTEIMRQYAAQHGLPFEHNVPSVDANSFSRFNKTRVIVKDQWASHPSTNDRETHLRSLNLSTTVVQLQAWTLFHKAEELQKQVTEKLYEEVKFEKPVNIVSLTKFTEQYAKNLAMYQLPNVYKGYFDYRDITVTDLRNLENKSYPGETLDSILTDETLSLPYRIDGLKSDIQTLDAIGAGSLPVKSFEFGGQKYSRDDAYGLKIQLENELKEAEAQRVTTDERVIAFALNDAHAKGKKERLRQKYSELFLITSSAAEDMKKYMEMMTDIMPIYHGTLEFPKIRQIMEKVRLNEVLIKDRMKTMLADDECARHISDADRAIAAEYLSKDLVYFLEPNYNEKALGIFNDSMNIYYNLFSERSMMKRKEVLEFQVEK